MGGTSVQCFSVSEGNRITPKGFCLQNQASTTCKPKSKLQSKQVTTCRIAQLDLNINALTEMHVCVCGWFCVYLLASRCVRTLNVTQYSYGSNVYRRLRRVV
uniref:Uncharacterized protein n=1 Tax=Rhipicephalus appendiculatus TaxID=34631 RepID=A0A131YBR8_RHIAP